MRRLLAMVLCGALVALLAACGAPQAASAEPPAEAPYVKGTIVSVVATEPVTEDCVSESDLDPDGTVSSDDPPMCNPNPSVFGTVHVRGSTEVVATVGKTTPIVDAEGAAVAFEDLAEGAAVSVWMEGPIMESFPAQGAASFLLVED